MRIVGQVSSSFLLLLVLNSTPTVSTQNTCPLGVSGYKVVRCPDGWARYKLAKCFKLFSNKQASNHDAQNICREHDPYLASIHSDEELQFLKSYILRDSPLEKLRNTWIGGIKKGKLWIWDDLSPFDYTNWLPGYPDEAKCAELITHVGF